MNTYKNHCIDLSLLYNDKIKIKNNLNKLASIRG